jgi:hypothetical protein
MREKQILEKIWEGDRLHRHHEADTIQKYLLRETEVLRKLGREQSIVLGIDAPYGLGKTWFLERLAKQLTLSHPVARIDAWADDVGDEPLTAFMAAIDDALSPYLTVSKKLSDRLAAVKASALPVMGKLVSGALMKALTKVAGDEIEEQLGEAIEQAIRGATQDQAAGEDGAAALAMTSALEGLQKEIDSLVDRRGAAMLAAYRQRRSSRQVFQTNMRELVSIIDQSGGPGKAPLIVVIDELDRCRPNYAIRMLEEIKHFFEIPNVVFIIGLHGDQLEKSVKSIYGAEFAGDEYLRRFFSRRYRLREYPIVELAAAIFDEWGIDEKKFKFPDPSPTLPAGYPLSNSRIVGLILSQWSVTPREISAVMDGLRLFAEGWEHPDPIDPIALLSLLIGMVRGQELDFRGDKVKTDVQFEGISWDLQRGQGTPESFNIKSYLDVLRGLVWRPLREIEQEGPNRNSAHNYVVEWLKLEWRRRTDGRRGNKFQSHFADYIPRITDLARFIDEVDQERRA